MSDKRKRYDRDGIEIHPPVRTQGYPNASLLEWRIGDHQIVRRLVPRREGGRVWEWFLDDEPSSWRPVAGILKANAARLGAR